MTASTAAHLTLAFATPSLAPALARIDRLAFQNTSLYRALYQNVSNIEYEHFRAAQLANEMHPWFYVRGRRHLAAWLDGQSASPMPTLAGYLSWEQVKPDRLLSPVEAKWERPGKPAMPEEARAGVKEEVFGRVAAEAFGLELGPRLCERQDESCGFFDPTPCSLTSSESRVVDLISLAVDPACQRRGVANALLQNALNRADAAGRPAYLHAAPEAATLYLKLGFELCGPNIVAQDGSFRVRSCPALGCCSELRS